MLERISIDSLSLRIPINRVTILDHTLSEHKLVIGEDTAEIHKTIKEQSKEVWGVGYKTRYCLQDQVTRGNRTESFLVIQFNSKLLERLYLEGIRLDNIEGLYQRLLSHKIVDMSYDSFLSGECTDIDFKKDLLNDDFSETLKVLVRGAKGSKKLGQGYYLKNSKNNRGIQFGTRELSDHSMPFLKVYHKGVELVYKSTEFYKEFIEGQENVFNRIRVETTVKNKRHFKRLKITDTSLGNILSLEQNVLESILLESIKKNLEPRQMTPRKTDKMTPADAVHVSSIEMLISNGISFHNVLEYLLYNVDGKVSKSRMKAKLKGLYNDYIRDTEVDVIAEKQETFFEEMGWS